MIPIPDAFLDLLERPIVVSLATTMPNGEIQTNPVWADVADGKIRVNTVAGRQKHHNMRDRKHATILAVDPGNPMRWIEVRGEVSGMTEADGIEVIDKLSRDYIGVFPYPWHKEADTRVTCHISPIRVVTNAG